MTDQNPTPDEVDDQLDELETDPEPTPDPTPAPDPEPSPDDDPEPADPTGHAVYDATILRFVSGVYPTKAKATAARKAIAGNGHKLEIRKV